MTLPIDEAHGLFTTVFNERDEVVEAYCECGEYETAATRTCAEIVLLERHLAVVDEAVSR